MTRPDQLVVVAGTRTEVGKTWLTARLATELLRRSMAVSVRKPVQSFDPGDRGPTDAAVLAGASGEPVHDVCPPHRWYPRPMAPPMAAGALDLPPPTLRELLAELTWPPGIDVGIVELVGGIRSPLADDADSRDLALALQPDRVVLVADAGLGVIDAVRSSVGALAPLTPTVFLNRYNAAEDLHRRNRAWLADRDRIETDVTVAAVADRFHRRPG